MLKWNFVHFHALILVDEWLEGEKTKNLGIKSVLDFDIFVLKSFKDTHPRCCWEFIKDPFTKSVINQINVARLEKLNPFDLIYVV